MPLPIYSLELKPDSAILPSIGVNPAILNSIIFQVDLILRLLNIHLTFLATTNSQNTIENEEESDGIAAVSVCCGGLRRRYDSVVKF